MKNKQIIKKVAFGFVIVAVIALIGLSIYQNLRFKKLSQIADSGLSKGNQSPVMASSTSNESQQKNADVNVSKTVQINGSNPDDINALKGQLDSTEKELDSANKKLSDEISRKAELRKKEAEAYKQYLKDPSSKNFIKTYLDTSYADLFKELNLSSEKLDKLKDLIAEFQMGYSEVNMDSYSANTDQEKAALRKRADEIYNNNQSKLKDLLGDADYQKYQDYYERYDSRSTVNGFMDSLGADEKLTKDQEKTLVEIMYKEQTKVFSEIGYDPNKSVEFISDIKAGKIDGKVKNIEKIFSGSVQNANGILTASQLEKFKKYLKEYHEKFELSYQAYN
jgi:hypothetical protein